jgi:hypothetical protein
MAASLLAIIALLPGLATAKSSLLLPYPPDMGDVQAVTFDTTGKQVGRSAFSLVSKEDGRLLLSVVMGIEDGGENRIEAELEPVAQGLIANRPQLRIVRERSQSFTADGAAMALLQIDHVAGTASCTPPGEGDEARVTLPLPTEDRVANVPLHLLFLPLARGEVDSIRFQLFTCRGGPRIHEFVALRGGPPVETPNGRVIEIRYGPDLGTMMSWVASQVMPKLSFWFDETQDGAYMGHRMPLYSKGPEIFVVRNGVQPDALGMPQPAGSGILPAVSTPSAGGK